MSTCIFGSLLRVMEDSWVVGGPTFGQQGGVSIRFDTSRVAAHAGDSNTAEGKGRETVVSAALLVGADGLRSAVRALIVGDHPCRL